MYPDHETFLRGYCWKIIPEFRFSKAIVPGATRFAIDFVFDPPRNERGLQMRMTGTTYKTATTKPWAGMKLHFCGKYKRPLQESAAASMFGSDS
jgi:hypothetical protein